MPMLLYPPLRKRVRYTSNNTQRNTQRDRELAILSSINRNRDLPPYSHIKKIKGDPVVKWLGRTLEIPRS